MDDKLTHIILTDHALRYGLDGKSAYEIAQKYGYEGTEQEYAEGPVIAKDKANKAADSADKVLLHICKPNVYQRFATVFYALFPRRLPSFCMVLRPPARFACAVAVSPCMTVQI